MSDGNVFLTDVSFADEETVTQEEWQKLKKWYEDCHGIGNLDLVKFMPFLVEHRPDALKRYRRFNESWTKIDGGLPPASFGCYWLHYYTRLGYAKGVLYIIIAARHWGVSKSAVKDLLALAFVMSGPLGPNAWGDIAEEYMRAWPDDAPSNTDLWPAHWTYDPSVLASGIDLKKDGMTAEEMKKLEEWHLKWQGEVPSYVPFLGKHLPQILKTYRNRFERALTGALPVPIVPLVQLHLAAIEGRPGMRRLATHAKALGATKAHVLQALSLAFLYIPDGGMEKVTESLSDVLDRWDD